MSVTVARIRLLLVVAFAAVMVAFGVRAVGWYRSGDQLAAPGVTQTVQAGDLGVMMQLDDAALGQRVIDVFITDAAGAPIDASALRLRFSWPGWIWGTAKPTAGGGGAGH